MATTLPPPLSDYFAATNARDFEAMIACFAEDAVVKDEKQEHRGLAEIRAWMRETIEKYNFKADPVSSTQSEAATTVQVTLSGKFPGSPITVRYKIAVDGEKISRLEID